MSKVPRDTKGQRAARAFQKIGYYIDHQTGSHVIMYHPTRKRLSIPYGKLKVGLLASLIKDAGLTIEEFKKVL